MKHPSSIKNLFAEGMYTLRCLFLSYGMNQIVNAVASPVHIVACLSSEHQLGKKSLRFKSTLPEVSRSISCRKTT